MLNKRAVDVDSAELIFEDSDLFAWCFKVNKGKSEGMAG